MERYQFNELTQDVGDAGDVDAFPSSRQDVLEVVAILLAPLDVPDAGADDDVAARGASCAYGAAREVPFDVADANAYDDGAAAIDEG